MNKKNLIAVILFSLFLLISIPVTIYLVKQRQELRKEAAVPTGVTTIELQPITGTMAVGSTLTVDFVIDLGAYEITGVTAVLDLSYDSDTPPLEIVDQDSVAGGIQVQASIAELDYTAPNSNIVTVDEINKNIRIRLSGYAISGYTNSQPVTFGQFTMRGLSPGTVTAVFEPNFTKITERQEGADILLTPSSGSYTVTGGVEATATPTPTTAPGVTVTPTPTLSPGTTVTPTPTTAPGATTTPTPTPTSSGTGGTVSTPTPTTVASGGQLPESGTLTPTLFLTGGGVLLLSIFFLILFI